MGGISSCICFYCGNFRSLSSDTVYVYAFATKIFRFRFSHPTMRCKCDVVSDFLAYVCTSQCARMCLCVSVSNIFTTILLHISRTHQFSDFPHGNLTSLALHKIGTLWLWPVNVITWCCCFLSMYVSYAYYIIVLYTLYVLCRLMMYLCMRVHECVFAKNTASLFYFHIYI